LVTPFLSVGEAVAYYFTPRVATFRNNGLWLVITEVLHKPPSIPDSVGHVLIDHQWWVTVSVLDPVQCRLDGLDPSRSLLQPHRPRLAHR